MSLMHSWDIGLWFRISIPQVSYSRHWGEGHVVLLWEVFFFVAGGDEGPVTMFSAENWQEIEDEATSFAALWLACGWPVVGQDGRSSVVALHVDLRPKSWSLHKIINGWDSFSFNVLYITDNERCKIHCFNIRWCIGVQRCFQKEKPCFDSQVTQTLYLIIGYDMKKLKFTEIGALSPQTAQELL